MTQKITLDQQIVVDQALEIIEQRHLIIDLKNKLKDSEKYIIELLEDVRFWQYHATGVEP